jgi:hypothetical protein
MSRRFQIVLPDPLAEQLCDLAASAGEPPSTLAAGLVRAGVCAAVKGERTANRDRRRPAPGSRRERPHWLEPFGGDPGWRREMWGAIVALYGRYPRLLEGLKEGWWGDEAATEMLCALTVWRAELDEVAAGPREELSFHRELADFAALVRQQGGGVASSWAPGAPPPEWLGI